MRAAGAQYDSEKAGELEEARGKSRFVRFLEGLEGQ
jgi:hypothetical protein